MVGLVESGLSCFLLLNWVIQRMCRLLLGLGVAKPKASSCWYLASFEWPEKAIWGWSGKKLFQPLYLNIQTHCLLNQPKKVKELGNFHIRRKPAGQGLHPKAGVNSPPPLLFWGIFRGDFGLKIPLVMDCLNSRKFFKPWTLLFWLNSSLLTKAQWSFPKCTLSEAWNPSLSQWRNMFQDLFMWSRSKNGSQVPLESTELTDLRHVGQRKKISPLHMNSVSVSQQWQCWHFGQIITHCRKLSCV